MVGARFNDVEETSDLQDNLEYVMEKIWCECPAAGHLRSIKDVLASVRQQRDPGGSLELAP